MTTLYSFHVNVFARSKHEPFCCTWEDAAQRLAALPRMIFEPDGSFVVSGDEAGLRWQVDGHLFDFAGHLQRLELHGDCPSAAFDALLACVGWPEQPLVIEMVRAGVTVDEAEFRSLAAR